MNRVIVLTISLFAASMAALWPLSALATLDAVRNQQRALWMDRPLSPSMVAAHPRVFVVVTRRVAEGMVRMDQDMEGGELLKAMSFRGIAPAKDADYDGVRRLQLRMPE